ncbi:hypothetical protein PCANC_06436 [Puccinia coronata f. sp. avenae]|uniref:Uncharacterized protein n=1 Tax=Puccinia coronata f. sp. avenae TaxID=200324 RepID=A0A2N5VVP4_9BASI|nr:hypothetical protein PCANC_06436 [Puccinia coronata f. sp. avenae]
MSIDPSPTTRLLSEARDVHRHQDTSPGQAHDDLQHIPGPMVLFVNAKESGNYRLMRIALNQAISTQDTLTNLFGTQRMLEVSDGWLARDELARMEQTSTATATPASAAATTPSASDLRGPRQHSAYQVAAPPPAPGQMIPGTEPQPGTFQQEAQPPYPPLQYPEQEAYYGQDSYYYPPQPPHHAHYSYAQPYQPGNQFHHPYQRNRHCADPMTRYPQILLKNQNLRQNSP